MRPNLKRRVMEHRRTVLSYGKARTKWVRNMHELDIPSNEMRAITRTYTIESTGKKEFIRHDLNTELVTALFKTLDGRQIMLDYGTDDKDTIWFDAEMTVKFRAYVTYYIPL